MAVCSNSGCSDSIGSFAGICHEYVLTRAQILPSGFTGVASLLEKITGQFFGIHFSTSLGMIALNLPVAAFCYRQIGKKFVIFSMLQVFLASFFLRLSLFEPLFEDELLNICFGGFLYGLAIVVALKGNASTAGTDFIALYVSNRLGKAIWQYVFAFNAAMLCIFGYLFGWEYAGYSIMFQFISTKTIDSFYHRYKRIMLQVTTEDPGRSGKRICEKLPPWNLCAGRTWRIQR